MWVEHQTPEVYWHIPLHTSSLPVSCVNECFHSFQFRKHLYSQIWVSLKFDECKISGWKKLLSALMKGMCTDLGLETSVCGFKRTCAQRRFPFLTFLLKHAIVVRQNHILQYLQKAWLTLLMSSSVLCKKFHSLQFKYWCKWRLSKASKVCKRRP